MRLLMMSATPSGPHLGRRRFASLREHLLAEIDALALELEEAEEATSSSRAPISARADYLRALDAYRRAQIAWSTAHGRDELTAVADALRDCRTALESSRALLRG
jgi:multidrug resistance efflux pump